MRGLRFAIVVSTLAVLAAQIGVAAGLPGATVTDPPEGSGEGLPGMEQVGDIVHIANIGDNTGWSGSDIELASREVVKLSNGATGDPVCVADASQPDGCARDAAGDVVYQKEVRDFAIAGGYGQNGRIIDITDPRNPVHVNNTPCSISQNDIQIQGDLLLVAADGNGSCKRPDGTTASFAGTAVLDFTDPRNPTYVSRLQYSRGSHNHTFVPGKPFVYLSDSDVANAGLGNIPVWDVSDPANPVMRTEFKFGGHSPHDITFNADGTRAYVAAVSLTYILNTENPAAPTMVSVIPNEGISISHQSDPTPDGDFLLVSDELGGGAAGASPGGAVHVYDIRDETHPVKVGLIYDDCVGVSASCEGTPAADVPVSTSHVFRINPDGYTMAIAWYKDGVHVIDYSGIRGAQVAGTGAASNVGPRTIGRMRMPGANTWSAKMWQERHPGYVFANDIARGFDVYYVSSMGPGFVGYGTIGAAHPGNYSADTGVTRTEWESDCEYSPRSNGVDGWIATVPAEYADGTYQMTATGQGLGFDLDMYFYDQACALLGTAEDAELNEIGDIPEGTAYVMVTNYLGTTNPVENPVHVRLSASPIGG